MITAKGNACHVEVDATSLIVLGILAVTIGIIAIAWPDVTILALVILFAGYAFMDAGLQAVRAFSSRTAGPVFGHLLLGLMDLAAGAIALARARALESAGVLLSADVLQPTAATTTVTCQDGGPRVQGPFARRRRRWPGSSCSRCPASTRPSAGPRSAPAPSGGDGGAAYRDRLRRRRADTLTSASGRAGLAARDSFGRLLALLTASTSDLAAAEDALADAFELALRTWPSQRVPDSVGRRKGVGDQRRGQLGRGA